MPFLRDEEAEALVYAPGLLWLMLHYRLLEIGARHNRKARREAWRKGAPLTWEMRDGIVHYSDGTRLPAIQGNAVVATFIETGTDATQGLEFYKSVAGTVASSTTQVATGPRAIKMTSGAGGTNASVTCPDNTLADAGSRISIWLYLTAIPTNTLGIIWTADNGITKYSFSVRVSSAGKLQLWRSTDTAQIGTDGSTLSINTWYRICLSYTIASTTVNDAKVYLGKSTDVPAYSGNIESNLTAHNVTTVTGTGGLTFGWLNSGRGNSIDTYWDNVYIDNGSDLTDCGAVCCTSKRPVANGSLNQWTTQIGAGGSGYGTGHAPQVNEQPLSATNGWSINSASLQTEEYSVEGRATGDVDLTGLTIVDWGAYAYLKVGSASTGNLIVGGVAANIAVTTSNALFRGFAGSTTYPTGNTDVGVDNNSVNQLFSLAEAGVLVAYTNVAVAVTSGPPRTLLGWGN